MLILTGGKLRKHKRSLRSTSQSTGKLIFRRLKRFIFDDIDDDGEDNTTTLRRAQQQLEEAEARAALAENRIAAAASKI